MDEMEALAVDLKDAWRRYRSLFGEDPHGTEQQMKALLALTRRYGAKMTAFDAGCACRGADRDEDLHERSCPAFVSDAAGELNASGK